MNQMMQSHTLTMSSREIAEVVDSRHDSVKRTIETLQERGLIAFTQTVEKTSGRPASVYHVNKRDSYVVVAQLSPEFTARLVDRWEALESGTAKPISSQPSIPATMALCELAITVLRPSDSGKVVMLQKAGKATGADTSFLPDYTEDSAPGHVGAMDTASATQLLREHGVKCTAAAFNERLRQIGLLEQRSRKSTGGKAKRFWCITNEGTAYGKNVVSPQSPRETQPHWYRARFVELVTLIGLECAA